MLFVIPAKEGVIVAHELIGVINMALVVVQTHLQHLSIRKVGTDFECKLVSGKVSVSIMRTTLHKGDLCRVVVTKLSWSASVVIRPLP
jgi:hypothetical protein